MGYPALAPKATYELCDAFHAWGSGPSLNQGPVWTSFDAFKRNGNDGLASMPVCHVGRLQTKAGVFRVMHDADFQRILGIASDVCRLQNGVRMVIQAAKVAVKHPDDEESRGLLITSASLIANSPELPQRVGHDPFEISPEEIAENADEKINAASIPRPKLSK